MVEPQSLINLGEFAKPVDTLIKKASCAVGVLWEPAQIKRVAKAKAEAAIIAAEAELEIHDIHQRAMLRFVHEETRKQENIESIALKALALVEETARPEQIEDDWMTAFFDKCRYTSDEEIQRLWARILAGEANDPGRFSKLTMNVLAAVDREDAIAFTSLGRFCWMLSGLTPLIIDQKDRLYREHGIDMNALIRLEEVGLIVRHPSESLDEADLPRQVIVHYYGQPFIVNISERGFDRLQLGMVALTRAGRELVSICGSKAIGEVPEHVIRYWDGCGHTISSPWPKADNESRSVDSTLEPFRRESGYASASGEQYCIRRR